MDAPVTKKLSTGLFISLLISYVVSISFSYQLSFLIKILVHVRNPKQLIASFAQVINSPTMQDIGLQKSWELFNKIENKNPVVLDSAEILKNPKILLSKLCDKLEIPFYEEMLSWPAGGIKEDGAWAEYWYKNVHNSTGFTKQKTSSRESVSYTHLTLPTICRV